MSIPIKLYFPDDFFQLNQNLIEKNDELEKKLIDRIKYWDNIYGRILKQLLNTDSKNLIQVSKLSELEVLVINIHESVSREQKKLIRQLVKSDNSLDDFEAEMNVFYLSREEVLNISNPKRVRESLVGGLSREKERTSKLYESMIDYLDNLKDLLYELKFKINTTHNIINGNI